MSYLFLPVESRGGAIPYLDTVRHLRQNQHEAKIYLTDDLKNLSHDISDARILDSFNLQKTISGDKIFDSANNTLKLFLAARRVMSAWIPKSILSIEKAIKTGQIQPKNTIIVTTTVGAMYLGHYLLQRNFSNIIIAEPFRMLDWTNQWTDSSQFFPSPLPSETILRLLFNNHGKNISEKLLPDERLKVKFADIKNTISQQILMYSPQFAENNSQVSGYPYPDTEDETLPENIQNFINRAKDKGQILVTFTLGSMDIDEKQRQRIVQTFTQAILGSTVSASGIILGAESKQESNKFLHHNQFVRYGPLFMQSDLVVQHCGAGTTHSALIAGTPVFAIPFLRDQYDWSQKLSHLGLLLGSQKQQNFSNDYLAKLLTKENLSTAKLAATAASQREEKLFRHGIEELSKRILDRN